MLDYLDEADLTLAEAGDKGAQPHVAPALQIAISVIAWHGAHKADLIMKRQGLQPLSAMCDKRRRLTMTLARTLAADVSWAANCSLKTFMLTLRCFSAP